LTAEEHIKEMMKQYNEQNKELGSVLVNERENQMKKALEAVQQRKQRKEEEKVKAEEDRKRKEKEEKAEREKQIARVTAEREKRDGLLKAIQNKQKALFKECYSRPIYNFNRNLHENQVQNEDFQWLHDAKNSELQKQSYKQLLEKIEKLSHDVDRDLVALQKGRE
jgi:hypothetical protein